jgi:hypothetical protein
MPSCADASVPFWRSAGRRWWPGAAALQRWLDRLRSGAQGEGTKVRVFLSYSSRDRNEALAAKRTLEAAGCEVWLDVLAITIAAQLDEELFRNIDRANVFCLLLSPTSVASPWVEREIERALGQQARGLKVLPVILRPCDIPDALGGLVGLDAGEGLDQEHVQLRLVAAVLGAGEADGVRLSEAFRTFQAERQQQIEATRELPRLVRRHHLPMGCQPDPIPFGLLMAGGYEPVFQPRNAVSIRSRRSGARSSSRKRPIAAMVARTCPRWRLQPSQRSRCASNRARSCSGRAPSR